MEEDTIMTFWNSLEENPANLFRFFKRQEFYTVHFTDAEFLARNYFKSSEVVKFFKGNKNCPYINISKKVSEDLFRYLLVKNLYKIEIYTGGNGNWELSNTVSPGNLEFYQEILFSDVEVSSNNSLLAINIKKSFEGYTVYFGLVNLDKGSLEYCKSIESADKISKDGEYLTNLNAIIYQLNSRECIIPSKDNRPELNVLKNSLKESPILISEYNKSYFNSSQASDIIVKILSESKLGESKSAILSELQNSEGNEIVGCLNAAVSYLSLSSDDSYYDYFDLTALKLNNFMNISEKCNKDLNILPNSASSSKYDSIYGLLNCCRTNLGERLLMEWLRQPLRDIDTINVRLDVVEALITDNTLFSGLYDKLLKNIPDILRLSKRIFRKNVNLQDLYRVYHGLLTIKKIYNLFINYSGDFKAVIDREFTEKLKTFLGKCENFINMIESSIDLEAIKDHEYKIKADMDETLTNYDKKMKALKNQMDKEFNKVCNKIDMKPVKQVKFEYSSFIGYHFRVTRKEEKNLRNQKDINIKETLKDGVKFQSTHLETLNEEYMQYAGDYDKYQRSIVDEIIKISGEYVTSIQMLSGLLAKIDVLCSLAAVALSSSTGYTRPRLIPQTKTDKPSQIIKFKSCRHPLVERQDNIVSYIPNDVNFDTGSNRSFQIVTGPNMGGKSTYIRSVGTAVIMAQIGSFVACQAAEMSLFDSVLTRIGAGDCQIRGISTFMAEMLDMAWILKYSTENSLIIIDELGRGTSTYDGCGIASAVTEYLASDKLSCSLFATHFHEVTKLAHLHRNIINLHVTAVTEDNELTFLYQLQNGPADRSYGLELAKSIGLPTKVIDIATVKLKSLESIAEYSSEVTSDTIDAIKQICKEDVDNIPKDQWQEMLGKIL